MTAPHFDTEHVTVYEGDCIDVMRELPDASVDAVVTDPPYGLEFMGKEWDSFKTYAGGNPAMKPQGANVGGVTGGDFAAASYGYRQKNPRCRNCGKLQRGNGACKCPAPSWDTRTSESAFQFQAWTEDWATEALRVLKPGGHLLAFGGTRTFHRLTAGIEDAGFEIRDSIAWLYGSGFPKSLDVSKAIDKAAGAEREVVGSKLGQPGYHLNGKGHAGPAYSAALQQVTVEQRAAAAAITAPASDEAARWAGWGTALKPAFEPIVVARKPLTGTVAANVLQHGTGALNIDASRIAATDPAAYAAKGASVVGLDSNRNGDAYGEWTGKRTDSTSQLGRWPANVILDEHTAPLLDAQSGVLHTQKPTVPATMKSSHWGGGQPSTRQIQRDDGDATGASRFFYTAKASSSERPKVRADIGGDTSVNYSAGLKSRVCNVCESRGKPSGGEQSGKPWPTCGHDDWRLELPLPATGDFTSHPTVKPLDLMRWLVRLVTPKGGTVLEPFAGSGTTVEACVLEGFRCIAIEREADYLPLIMQRVSKPHAVGLDFGDWEDVS